MNKCQPLPFHMLTFQSRISIYSEKVFERNDKFSLKMSTLIKKTSIGIKTKQISSDFISLSDAVYTAFHGSVDLLVTNPWSTVEINKQEFDREESVTCRK